MSQKGGAGKTTLAVHLAVATGDALIVDTDKQKSASGWWRERDAELPEMALAEPQTVQKALGATKRRGCSSIYAAARGRGSEGHQRPCRLHPGTDPTGHPRSSRHCRHRGTGARQARSHRPELVRGREGGCRSRDRGRGAGRRFKPMASRSARSPSPSASSFPMRSPAGKP